MFSKREQKRHEINVICSGGFEACHNAGKRFNQFLKVLKAISIHLKRALLNDGIVCVDGGVVKLVLRYINTDINAWLHYFTLFQYRILFERATGAVLPARPRKAGGISNLPFDGSSMAKSIPIYRVDFKDSGKTPYEVFQRIPTGKIPKKIMSLLSLSPFKSLFQTTSKHMKF